MNATRACESSVESERCAVTVADASASNEPVAAERRRRRPASNIVPGAVATTFNDSRSAELYARARTVLAGGVNSPVRAMRAIGRDPIFIERASGAEIVDVDGNRYVDYVCSWGRAGRRSRAPGR